MIELAHLYDTNYTPNYIYATKYNKNPIWFDYEEQSNYYVLLSTNRTIMFNYKE